MSVGDKLPWRVQSKLGYRPTKTNKKNITSILRETQDIIPINKYKIVAKGYTFKLDEPKGYLNDFRHPHFLFNTEFPVENVFFASIKNGRYIQHSFIPTIIDSNNNILDGAQRHPFYYNPFKNQYENQLLSIQRIPQAKKLKGNVLCLATDGAHNGYFHVLLRLTAKLAVLKELGIDIDFFDKVIINGPEKAYKTECMKAANVPYNKLIFAYEDEHYEAETLFFIPRIRFHDLGHEYVKSIFKNEKETSLNNLYISRKDSKFRRILNEEELLNKINNTSLKIVELSKLTIQGQVHQFNNSKNIIGPHGAGFANLIFCEEGTNIFEIYDDLYVNVNYWFYAQIFKLNYHPVIGKSVVPKGNMKERLNNNDIILDTHIIEKLANQVI